MLFGQKYQKRFYPFDKGATLHESMKMLPGQKDGDAQSRTMIRRGKDNITIFRQC